MFVKYKTFIREKVLFEIHITSLVSSLSRKDIWSLNNPFYIYRYLVQRIAFALKVTNRFSKLLPKPEHYVQSKRIHPNLLHQSQLDHVGSGSYDM